RRKINFSAVVYAIILCAILFFSNTALGTVYHTAKGNDPYTPYGSYSASNVVPGYVEKIYEDITCNSSYTNQKILFLPDYPRVERWASLSPVFFSFPPGNNEELSLFQTFVNDVANFDENGSGEILSQLNIGFIVIVNSLNQTQTQPRIGYDNFGEPYAIFGPPSTFKSYFGHSSDFLLMSHNKNYSLYRNILNTGLFQAYYGGIEASNKIATYSVSEYLNASLNLLNTTSQIDFNGLNLLSSNTSQGEGWSDFAKNVTMSEITNSTLRIDFPNRINRSVYSYFSRGIPVASGDIFKLSSNINSLSNNSFAYFAQGFNLSIKNMQILPGKYWQNGIYKVENGSKLLVSGLFTVPKNVTYILPYMIMWNAVGEFRVSNISMSIISISNNSSTYSTVNSTPTVHSFDNLNLQDSIENSFRNVPFISGDITKDHPNVIRTYLYDNSTNNNSMYMLPSYYASSTRSGYVWSNELYSVMNPRSFLGYTLKVSNGSYVLVLQIIGYGTGSVKMDGANLIYDTFFSGEKKFLIPINVSDGELNFSILNAVGVIDLANEFLVGPGFNARDSRILFNDALSTSFVISSIGVNPEFNISLKNYNISYLLIMKESYNDGWISIDYNKNGSYISEPLEYNGWGMAFIVLSNSTHMFVSFKSPIIPLLTLYFTAITLPITVFLYLAVNFYEIGTLKRKKRCL
ncbi:MAG: hypothetical protein QXU18_15520, partial [Thermoplasmatales archaeon]